jgi:hypothetical protein
MMLTGPSPSHSPPSPLALPPATAGARADAGFLLRWTLLGTAAGGVAGLLVGGVGGRLAMLLLRLTSPDLVVGVQSDDGFTIGRVSFSTIFLLLVTGAIGALGGIAYVALRGFVPSRLRVAVWTIVSGAVGGAVILHADGVDFRLLEPSWLACALFVVIPAGGGAVTAWPPGSRPCRCCSSRPCSDRWPWPSAPPRQPDGYPSCGPGRRRAGAGSSPWAPRP